MTRAAFGDFWDLATACLDSPAGAGDPPGRGQIPAARRALRRVITALRGYLEDIPAFRYASAAPGRDSAGAWVRAAARTREALIAAEQGLPRPQIERGTIVRARPANHLAARLDAAAEALILGRDLLATHVTEGPRGDRQARSAWAAAIASNAVNRALLARIGDLACMIAAQPYHDRYKLAVTSARLRQMGADIQAAQLAAPVLEGDFWLLDAIPVNSLPPRQVPQGGDGPAGLAAGAVAAAERARHAAGFPASPARWAVDMTASSMRHTAAAAVVTSHNCAVILESLADRAAWAGYPHMAPGLREAGAAGFAAVSAWRGAARGWDLVATDTDRLRRASAAAEETGNLALWTGRLAYGDPTWTPASGPARPRPAEQLAPAAGAFAWGIAAVHYAADALGWVAAAGQEQVRGAAAARRLYVPCRITTGDVPRPWAPAPAGRIDSLLDAYAAAQNDSRRLAEAAAWAAEVTAGPSRALAAAARVIQRGGEQAGPAGLVEQAARDLGVTDPDLLARAAAADRAAGEILADACAQRPGPRQARRGARRAAAWRGPPAPAVTWQPAPAGQPAPDRPEPPPRPDGKGASWVLADDGIVDPVAVTRAVAGEAVPLTRRERDAAVGEIIAAGGGPARLAERLHFSGQRARARYELAAGQPAEPDHREPEM